jgi:hypothetical protein
MGLFIFRLIFPYIHLYGILSVWETALLDTHNKYIIYPVRDLALNFQQAILKAFQILR